VAGTRSRSNRGAGNSGEELLAAGRKIEPGNIGDSVTLGHLDHIVRVEPFGVVSVGPVVGTYRSHITSERVHRDEAPDSVGVHGSDDSPSVGRDTRVVVALRG